jgi:hypothetical protein
MKVRPEVGCQADIASHKTPRRNNEEPNDMKVMLLLTAGGPMVIITSADVPTDPGLIAELHDKGIDKFIAYDIPVELAQERYGSHFHAVAHDIHETDKLHVLDYSGHRAFKLFRFEDLGPPTRYEAPEGY